MALATSRTAVTVVSAPSISYVGFPTACFEVRSQETQALEETVCRFKQVFPVSVLQDKMNKHIAQLC